MKNLLFVLSLSFLTLFSCSSNEPTSDDGNNNNNDFNGVLLKSVVTANSINNYIYLNKNYLSKIVANNGSYAKYTYSGDLISSIEQFDKNDVLHYFRTYHYTNNRLTETREYSEGILENYTEFIYNSDGTVTAVSNSRSTTNGVETYNTSISKSYPDGTGNVIKSNFLTNNIKAKLHNGLL